MKHRFVKTILCALALSLVIILAIKMGTMYSLNQRMDYKLKPDTRVLVLGHSQGRDAICDSILDGWENHCADGEMYFGTYVIAKRILETNKVDTLIVHMADLHNYPDSVVDTSYYYYKYSRLAIGDPGLFLDLAKLNPNDMLSFLLTNDVATLFNPIQPDGYEHWDRHALLTDWDYLENYIHTHGRFKTIKGPIEDFSLQTRYLERIVQLCKQHNVKLILFSYPKYRRSFYLNRKKTWDYYAETLDDDVMIADYDEFLFPDTAYYAHVIHLNYMGAEYFSNYLKHHGLTLKTPKQWRKTRKD